MGQTSENEPISQRPIEYGLLLSSTLLFAIGSGLGNSSISHWVYVVACCVGVAAFHFDSRNKLPHKGAVTASSVFGVFVVGAILIWLLPANVPVQTETAIPQKIETAPAIINGNGTGNVASTGVNSPVSVTISDSDKVPGKGAQK
jgi:hypothetical protein